MLLKVKYFSVKKYIKLHSGFTFLEFISEGKIFFNPVCSVIPYNTAVNKYRNISESRAKQVDQLFSLCCSRFVSGDFLWLHSISTVKSKFGLPDAAQLDIFDETDTAVDEDILLELLEAHPDLCLTVREKTSDEGRCHQKIFCCQYSL